MSGEKKLISVSVMCFNEEHNLRELYERLLKVFNQLPQYDFEVIIADNYSTDGSRSILREIAAQDHRFKIILNSTNFGPVRSAHNALMSCRGDAAIPLCSDLQEPPELILEFIKKWEEGYKVVCAIKNKSRENPVMFLIRKIYYSLLSATAEGKILHNFTGLGLYDRQFIDALRKYNDPYPFLRGLITEIGFNRVEVPYTQEERKYGKSSFNYLSYYDYAMTGFVNQTKLPLRIAVFTGFILAICSFLVALGYLIYKLLYWPTFTLGLAPLVVGLFFFSAIQLIFIGIIGEYLGAVWTQVKNKPLVIEEERINFDD